MVGYTRQSIADIVPGEDVRAEPLDAEFNRLQSAFGTTGHTHDGTAGNGPKISLTSGVMGVLPFSNGGASKINNTAVTNPTVNDDESQGYTVGSLWMNTAASTAFILVRSQTGMAMWNQIQSPTGTFLQPANNLSDVSNLSTARQNLGLVIGNTVQAYSLRLDALAGFSTDSRVPYTAGGTYQTFGTTSFTRGIMNNSSAASFKGALVLDNVNNTADIDKPVSTATQDALNLKANLANPSFTGTPSAPTASIGTSTTQLATTAFVQTALTTVQQSPLYPIYISSPTSGSVVTGIQTFIAKAQGYPADNIGYYSLYGFPQTSRTLNIYQAAAPSVIFKTVTVSGSGNSITANLANLGLSVSSNYLAEIVFTDALNNTTTSTKLPFTTPAQFRPNIGDAYQGGYYTGQINDGGTVYDLIVAPKSGGETTAVWYTSSVTFNAPSRSNGPQNTTVIVNNSQQAAAAYFCDQLVLNGYSDWYLPAIDELELAYRNLKPGTANNSTPGGTNSNSVPAGSAYTTTNPSQTAVASFIQGGSEAFANGTSGVTGGYWTSTEVSSSNAYIIAFFNGAQQSQTKTSTFSVRAFRRVPA